MHGDIRLTTTDDLTSLLEPAELMLWSERRQHLLDDTAGLLLISSGILLMVDGALWMAFLYKGSLESDNADLLLFLLALSLCGFLLAGLKVLVNGSQVYLLTNKRAIIAVRILRSLRCVHEFPLSRHMLKGIIRYADHHADYAFAWQRVGKTTQVPVGFIGVKHTAQLESALVRCGIHIPSELAPKG